MHFIHSYQIIYIYIIIINMLHTQIIIWHLKTFKMNTPGSFHGRLLAQSHRLSQQRLEEPCWAVMAHRCRHPKCPPDGQRVRGVDGGDCCHLKWLLVVPVSFINLVIESSWKDSTRHQSFSACKSHMGISNRSVTTEVSALSSTKGTFKPMYFCMV